MTTLFVIGILALVLITGIVVVEIGCRKAQDLAIRTANRAGELAKTWESTDYHAALVGIPAPLVNEYRDRLETIDNSTYKAYYLYTLLAADDKMSPHHRCWKDGYAILTSIYGECAGELERAVVLRDGILKEISTTRQQLSASGRTARHIELKLSLSTCGQVLRDCSSMFDTSEFQQDVDRLTADLKAAAPGLKREDARGVYESHLELQRLQQDVAALLDECKRLYAARRRIVNAPQSLRRVINESRQKLRSLRHVDTAEALNDLLVAESEIDDFVASLVPSETPIVPLEQIDAFVQRITWPVGELAEKEKVMQRTIDNAFNSGVLCSAILPAA